MDYLQQSCKKNPADSGREKLINCVAFLRDRKALGQRTISTKLHVVLQLLAAV